MDVILISLHTPAYEGLLSWVRGLCETCQSRQCEGTFCPECKGRKFSIDLAICIVSEEIASLDSSTSKRGFTLTTDYYNNEGISRLEEC